MIHLHEPGEPTLVLLHGTGGDEVDFLAFGKSLIGGVGYLAIRGQEREFGQNRWFRRFAEGVFDIPNLLERTDELADFVIRTVPEGRRIAVGFSNGANIAAAVLLKRPEVFDAAALLAPMVPYEPETLPDLTGKSILMVCGEQDPIVPLANAQTLATMLTTAGASVQLHLHPGGHQPDVTSQIVLRSWLARQKSGLGAE